MNKNPIVVEQEFAVAPEIVWAAITSPEQMRQWYFEQIEDFKAEVGFLAEFVVQFEDRLFKHQWEITEAIQNKRLAYDWSYKGIEGQSKLVWELNATDCGTHVKISHAGNESFDQTDPLLKREAGVAGWKYLIQQSLKEFLEQK